MKPQGEMHLLSTPFRRLQSASKDLITDLPEIQKGNDATVVFVDRLSKMVHFVPCTKSVDAEQWGELLERKVFRLHGIPQDIVSDRNVRFKSTCWQDSCEHLRIKLSLSTAQHPRSD